MTEGQAYSGSTSAQPSIGSWVWAYESDGTEMKLARAVRAKDVWESDLVMTPFGGWLRVSEVSNWSKGGVKISFIDGDWETFESDELLVVMRG